MKLNLQMFAGGHSVTVYKDAHMTTASASPYSDVAKDATVALTITPASGYELAAIEVVAGGVTITETSGSYSFTMGEADVVLNVTSKKSTMYKVVENTITSVNGTVTKLTRNMMLKEGPNGAIIGVDCTPTDLGSLSADIIAALVASGAIIKV